MGEVRGSRLFFALCLVAAAAILLLPLASGFGAARTIPAPVTVGLAIWRDQGCELCHTLFGQGGAYAPDLTHIYNQRGANYLREFLFNPGAFYHDGRVMPRFTLSIEEMEHVFALLEWAGDQPAAQTWPPGPILVSGGGIISAPPTTGDLSASADSLPSDPAARGRYWFTRPPAACATCHSLEPDVVIVGPSLAGIAARAAERVPGQSAEAYIRASVLRPGEFIVPGFQNVMAQNLGEIMTVDQINDIIAFLLTLE